eukprot:COSAG01_NODE_5176_length_4432_cov_5.631202_3_plen_89_part_00
MAQCVSMGFNRAISVGWLAVPEVSGDRRGAAVGALEHLLKHELPPPSTSAGMMMMTQQQQQQQQQTPPARPTPQKVAGKNKSSRKKKR